MYEDDEMPVSRVTIPATAFYTNPAEKTKLHWFTFEIALSFQSALRDPALASLRARQRITEQQIATFCIRYAKHMQGVILRVLRGELPQVVMPYQPIEAIWPRLSEPELNTIQDHLAAAWEQQLQICGLCPTRCISDKESICVMFDDPDYTDAQV